MSYSPIAEITMFGGLSIRYGNNVIKDDSNRSRRVWILLCYMISNRNSTISLDRLTEILWGDEDCNNPAGAVRNLVYRIRRTLEPLCFDKEPEWIVSQGNTYSWNNDIPCKIDTELFEQSYRHANAPGTSSDTCMQACLQLISLYKGDYMPQFSTVDWMSMQAAHYKNAYLNSVQKVCALLLAQKRPEEVVDLCEKAIAVDPYDEAIHGLLIRAYIALNQHKKAISHYKYIRERLYAELGVTLSEEISTSVNRLFHSDHKEENDIDVISNSLQENCFTGGAYYCDYEAFQNIFHHQARMAQRLGQVVFVALLTLQATNAGLFDPESDQRILHCMQMLKPIILNCLRKSDTVARYSYSQYVLMLPTQTCENGMMVVRRILRRFKSEMKTEAVTLTAKLNPIKPTEPDFFQSREMR